MTGDFCLTASAERDLDLGLSGRRDLDLSGCILCCDVGGAHLVSSAAEVTSRRPVRTARLSSLLNLVFKSADRSLGLGIICFEVDFE